VLEHRAAPIRAHDALASKFVSGSKLGSLQVADLAVHDERMRSLWLKVAATPSGALLVVGTGLVGLSRMSGIRFSERRSWLRRCYVDVDR